MPMPFRRHEQKRIVYTARNISFIVSELTIIYFSQQFASCSVIVAVWVLKHYQ